ncbi:MAG: hypothetical protein R3B93_13500 [Bacteroidia bacterium]
MKSLTKGARTARDQRKRSPEEQLFKSHTMQVSFPNANLIR